MIPENAASAGSDTSKTQFRVYTRLMIPENAASAGKTPSLAAPFPFRLMIPENAASAGFEIAVDFDDTAVPPDDS